MDSFSQLHKTKSDRLNHTVVLTRARPSEYAENI